MRPLGRAQIGRSATKSPRASASSTWLSEFSMPRGPPVTVAVFRLAGVGRWVKERRPSTARGRTRERFFVPQAAPAPRASNRPRATAISESSGRNAEKRAAPSAPRRCFSGPARRAEARQRGHNHVSGRRPRVPTWKDEPCTFLLRLLLPPLSVVHAGRSHHRRCAESANERGARPGCELAEGEPGIRGGQRKRLGPWRTTGLPVPL